MALKLLNPPDQTPEGFFAWAGKLIRDLNTYIAATHGVSAGMQVVWVSAVPPVGWLNCDGASYLVAAQPTLFAVIGYTFGGAGANFNVPTTAGFSIIKA